MSMTGNLRAAPDADIAAVLERPGRIVKLLYGDPAGDDTLGYLIEYYADLREFVRSTADRGPGLIVYLN